MDRWIVMELVYSRHNVRIRRGKKLLFIVLSLTLLPPYVRNHISVRSCRKRFFAMDNHGTSLF